MVLKVHTVVIAYKNTGYKNISVIRTFFSTPDDVLISDYYCTTICSGQLDQCKGSFKRYVTQNSRILDHLSNIITICNTKRIYLTHFATPIPPLRLCNV